MTISMSNLVDDLSRTVDSIVLRHGDSGYAEATSGYQLGYAHQPDVVVAATGAQDVVHAVRVAGGRRVPITVRATGHGLSGDRVGGVLVDTSRLRGVAVDPVARVASLQAGARWSDVIAAAAPHGLAPLSGSAPGVGAVGYTLEGGVGLLARRFGFAADHVRSVDVVTADGELRATSPDAHPDLFWAVRGGGGNFGIVTGMQIGLFPVAELYGGGLYFSGTDVERVLQGWSEWTASAPSALTSSIGLIPFPDRPTVPEPLRGRYVAHVRVAFLGPADEAERLLAPVRGLGTPVLDTLRPMAYAEAERIYDDPPAPMAYYATNTLVSELPGAAAATIVAMTGPGAAAPYVLQVNHMGGALADEPAVPGAVAHRPHQHVVRVLSRLAPGAGEAGAAELRAGHDALYRELGVPDGPLVPNFLLGGPVTEEQVRRGYHPDDYRRLTVLKARHDPNGVFSGYHPIPPRAA